MDVCPNLSGDKNPLTGPRIADCVVESRLRSHPISTQAFLTSFGGPTVLVAVQHNRFSGETIELSPVSVSSGPFFLDGCFRADISSQPVSQRLFGISQNGSSERTWEPAQAIPVVDAS